MFTKISRRYFGKTKSVEFVSEKIKAEYSRGI